MIDSHLAQTEVLPAGTTGYLKLVRSVPQMERAHRHRELELNLVVGGRAAYVVGNFRYALGAGTLVWLFPGQAHVLVEASPDFSYWLGVFGPSLVERSCGVADEATVLKQEAPEGRFCRVLPDPTPLAHAFAGVEHYTGAARHAGLTWALLAAWEAFSDAPEGSAISGVHPSVAHAVSALESGDEAWTLQSLARAVGLSAPYLSALFRAQVGIGFAEFRNRARLERYRRLTEENRMGVEMAAREAGFGSYAQFYRTFHAANGVAPRAHRRRGESS